MPAPTEALLEYLDRAAATDGSGIFSTLRDLFAANSEVRGLTLAFAPGRLFAEDDLVLTALAEDHAMIVSGGRLNMESRSVTRILNPGYSVLDAGAFLGNRSETRLRAGTDGVEILFVPRENLRQWMQECDGLLAGLCKALKTAHPHSAMPEEARDMIRTTRDQNILALVTREAISTVYRPDGVLDRLNPSKVELPRERDTATEYTPTAFAESSKRGTIEQTWELIRFLAPASLNLDREFLLQLAGESRIAAGISCQNREPQQTVAALAEFRKSVERAQFELLESLSPALSISLELAGYPAAQRAPVVDRFLQARWLTRRLVNEAGAVPPESRMADEIISLSLGDCGKSVCTGYTKILHLLDERLEVLFDMAVAHKLTDLDSIAFRKYDLEVSLSPPPGEELPRDHAMYRSLMSFEARLKNGETSAVGGSAYAEMRFPRELLEALSRREVPIVFYDGDHENGIRHVRERFGRNPENPSLLNPCTIVELQGAYGSFARSWIFFKDGTSVALVSYIGQLRQISNAAALLLFEDSNCTHIPATRMHLARDATPVRVRLESDLAAILRDERRRLQGAMVLGQRVEDPDALPSQIMILQHPKQFAAACAPDFELHEVRSGCLGNFYIGYWRDPAGQLTRVLMPTVGSSGLYGDTAGEFVKVAFQSGLLTRLVPHVFFTGTAGGFGGTADSAAFNARRLRGLPGLDPGALFLPLQGVTDAEGTIGMHTLLDSARERNDEAAMQAFEGLLRSSGVYFEDLHYSVAAPALETFELIDRIVADGHSSIDVESGPIMRAIQELRGDNPEITFTPIYFFSDNPYEARANPSHTLAFGGPLAEGAKECPELYKSVAGLMRLARQLG